jgi:hypothetical protein
MQVHAFFCMYSQQSGACFQPFIPCFRRFSGYRKTLAEVLPTLASLAAHFGMRRYEKRWTCDRSVIDIDKRIGAIMRIKQTLAFLGAAAVSSLALAAPAAPVSLSADGSSVTVHGNTSPVFRLSPVEADEVAGNFKLTDGRTLRLTNVSNRVYMEVSGKREQLLPLSRTDFVARNSGARVVLDQEPYADKVTLTQFRP